MSLILPATTASSQPVSPPANATARSDEQGQTNLVSFGEVLSRSLAPAGEITETTAAKVTKSTPARRQASDHKTDPEDPVNAMALPLGPLASSVVIAAPTGDAVAAPDNTVSAAVSAPLAALLPGRRQAGDQKTDPEDPVNAMALPFGPLANSAVIAAPTGDAVAASDNTVSAAVSTPLTALLPGRRQAGDQKTDPEDLVNAMALTFGPLASRLVQAAPTGDAVAAPDNTVSAAVTGAQTVLEPALAAASQKNDGEATLQAKLNPVTDSSALQLDPGKIAGQPIAPDTGAPDQSSKRADRAANKPDDMTDVIPDLTPAVTHSTAKVAAAVAAPSAETAATTITGSQAPAADTWSASAAFPINPVNATAQSPAGVSTANAPSPVPTPSLSPEVGSSEWGKALGQQVTQMGKTGHQVAELQLNPPGLGPLKVTLSMNDNQIQAMFVSAHSSVRAAVEAALPQLRTSLADSGISLGNTSVSSGSQQQTAFAHSQNGQPDHRSYRSNSMVDTAALTARPVTESLRQSNRITVDTYA